MAMDQYLYIPFLVGWTSIYQLFWCSPGVQGFDTLPYVVKCGIFFGDEYLSRIWFWQFLKDRLNSQFAIENGHRNSGFTHEKICTKNANYTGCCFGTSGLFFHLVGNFIIPTDELIFFRGVGIPPTSDQIWDMLGCSNYLFKVKHCN